MEPPYRLGSLAPPLTDEARAETTEVVGRHGRIEKYGTGRMAFVALQQRLGRISSAAGSGIGLFVLVLIGRIEAGLGGTGDSLGFGASRVGHDQCGLPTEVRLGLGRGQRRQHVAVPLAGRVTDGVAPSTSTLRSHPPRTIHTGAVPQLIRLGDELEQYRQNLHGSHAIPYPFGTVQVHQQQRQLGNVGSIPPPQKSTLEGPHLGEYQRVVERGTVPSLSR
mmetsp:Transcript_42706/g.129734  ORF Transcript_42706/g.129734 Transcript_42706/m.129734 type:complete len:221 (-) Transcript_42706:852-1514(-)